MRPEHRGYPYLTHLWPKILAGLSLPRHGAKGIITSLQTVLAGKALGMTHLKLKLNLYRRRRLGDPCLDTNLNDRREGRFTEGDGGEPRREVECTWGSVGGASPKSAIMVFGHDYVCNGHVNDFSVATFFSSSFCSIDSQA